MSRAIHGAVVERKSGGLAWSICGKRSASPYIRSARIGAGTRIPHAGESREVETDRTHLFDGNQSPGACRSMSFPVRRRQLVEDAATKLAYAFNCAPSGTSPSLR